MKKQKEKHRDEKKALKGNIHRVAKTTARAPCCCR
jgi:hypothetical protein